MTLEQAAYDLAVQRRILAVISKTTVTIYPRKGDHAKEKLVSINPIPEAVNPIALLQRGFTLDGNSATVSVDAHTAMRIDDTGMPAIERWEPAGMITGWKVGWTLTRAVHNVEGKLVEWLASLGYEVKFG